MACPVGNREKIYNIFETKPNNPSYHISTNHEVKTNSNGKYLISYGAWNKLLFKSREREWE